LQNQNKLKEKDSQIRVDWILFFVNERKKDFFSFQQYEIREIEFENRTKQKYELQIEGLQHDIEHLQKQVDFELDK